MINENDLRQGNLVQDTIELENGLVVFKIEPGIVTCGNSEFSHAYLSETLKPIPLTADILINYGFTESTNEFSGVEWREYFLEGEQVNIELKEDNKKGFFFHCDYGFTKLIYVHQLQNFYHSLTGEELKINI